MNFKNAAFSQYMYDNSFWRIGCIWWFCFPFFWSTLLSLHRKAFDNEEKGKTIMKLSYDITLLKARPRGYSLIEARQVWWGPKGMVVDPFMCETWKRLGFAPPCTRAVFIVFILLLVYYLFFFLYASIYLFFHSPFMNSGLGSEGNHIVTSYHHPNFPGVPPGAAGRVQW